MTKRQLQDVESVQYFIPKEYRHVGITETDTKHYLEWSERGLHTHLDRGKFTKPTTGIQALMLGKSRRGLHRDMWQAGVLDGSVPYHALFNDCPLGVVSFMAREMFKGVDYDLIMRYANFHHND